MAGRFADYCSAVVGQLGDRVRDWCLFNEPKTFTHVGYWYGAHAPGRKDALACLKATHTVNLAHGLGFRALKSVNPSLRVGSVFDVAAMVPATGTEADRKAAERWHKFLNLWFVTPVLDGRYPKGVLPSGQEEALLGFRPGDEVLMRAPLDFVGLNYYTRYTVHDAPEGNGMPGVNVRADWAEGPGLEKTDGGWAIDPKGFYDILIRMADAIGERPIEITEKRRRLQRLARRRRPCRRRQAHRLHTRSPRRAAASHHGRGSGSELPLLEPDGQFRMGGGLHAAVRPRRGRPCRIPETDHQGLGALVRTRGREQSYRLTEPNRPTGLRSRGALW